MARWGHPQLAEYLFNEERDLDVITQKEIEALRQEKKVLETIISKLKALIMAQPDIVEPT